MALSSPRPLVSTLDGLLAMFSPARAATISGKGRTAGYNWFPRDDGRPAANIPGDDVILKLAEHAKLTDAELGRVYRDLTRRRHPERRPVHVQSDQAGAR